MHAITKKTKQSSILKIENEVGIDETGNDGISA